MSETILSAAAVAGVIAATFLIVHTLSRRSAPAADGIAGPLTGRTDREPAGGSKERASLPDPTVWRSAIVPDLSAAEELLDWAEEEGYPERELHVLGNSTFLVRWRDGT
jgi:hypothetical protein